MDKYLLLLVAIGFGIARFFVPVTGEIEHADIFKDMAHVFVGGCFGAAILATRRSYEQEGLIGNWLLSILAEWKLWAIAWGLTILEIVAFFVRKGG